MLGELVQGMLTETFGNDPATRRAAALPYLFGAVAAGGQNALGGRQWEDAPGPLGF